MASEPDPVPDEVRDPEPFHRLHPSSLAFRIVGDLRKLVLPILILYFAKGEGSSELWYLLFFAPSLIVGIIQYFTVRYRFERDEMVVRKGFIFRNERHIPYPRIQNIDLVQGPIHRIFQVSDVRLETASGSEPEATFRVLSLAAVDTMRSRVFSGRTAPSLEPKTAGADEPGESTSETTSESSLGRILEPIHEPLREPETETVLELPTIELVKLGLISNRGMAVVAAASGLAWEFELHEKIEALEKYRPMIQSWDSDVLAVAGGVTAILGVALLFLFSVVWTVIRLHGFRLERVGDDLRLSFGLFTRLSATIPRHRIQFLTVRESIRHRLFGRVSVKVDTAGGGGANDDTAVSRHWFLPLVPREVLDDVLNRVLPELSVGDPEWLPLAPRARERMLKRSTIVGLMLATGACFVGWGWGLAVAVTVLPLLIWYASAAAGRYGYARRPGGIVFKSGVWTRWVSTTLDEKIQVISTSANYFDRRYGMASLRVDTAGAGAAGHRIAVPYLATETAAELRADLSEAAEKALFRW